MDMTRGGQAAIMSAIEAGNTDISVPAIPAVRAKVLVYEAKQSDCGGYNSFQDWLGGLSTRFQLDVFGASSLQVIERLVGLSAFDCLVIEGQADDDDISDIISHIVLLAPHLPILAFVDDSKKHAVHYMHQTACLAVLPRQHLTSIIFDSVFSSLLSVAALKADLTSVYKSRENGLEDAVDDAIMALSRVKVKFQDLTPALSHHHDDFEANIRELQHITSTLSEQVARLTSVYFGNGALLIQNTLTSLQSLAREKAVRLVFDWPAFDMPLPDNYKALQDALSELVASSIERSHSGEDIDVVLQTEHSDFVLSIYDDGIPVDDKTVSITRGLPVPAEDNFDTRIIKAMKSVKQLGGTLLVETTHQAGTVVTFNIPKRP